MQKFFVEDGEITEEIKNQFNTHFKALEALFPDRVGLTGEEIHNLWKMGRLNENYVNNIYNLVKSDICVPNLMKPEQFIKFVDLYMQMRPIISEMEMFVKGLNDTLMLLGSQIMYGCSVYYNTAKILIRQNDSEAIIVENDLKKRYEPQRRNRKKGNIQASDDNQAPETNNQAPETNNEDSPDKS